MKRFFIVLPLMSLLIGCLHGREKPIPTPQPQRPPTVQPEAPEPAAIPLPDLLPLKGRLICLDPGHGGRWPGAVAPSNGLRESDVNLRVALRLRDLLMQAGAHVLLTREDDSALNPERLSLDLAARAQVANREGAEVFLSIHHNADPASPSSKNDLEVYYKRRDDGASLDLAQALTRALAIRLRRDAVAKRLLPGNYKVIRTTRVPAVLIESSYLTQPRNAAFLATPAAVDAEAGALLAGLALYFALDPPRVAQLRIESNSDAKSHGILLKVQPGTPLDPDSLQVLLDGRPAPGHSNPIPDGMVYAFTEMLPNGDHTACIRIRSHLGAALASSIPFRVERPAARLRVSQEPRLIHPDTPIELMLEATVQDAFGSPVADGTEVVLLETGQTHRTVSGQARFYLPLTSCPDVLTFTSGEAYAETKPTFGPRALRTIRCLDLRTGQPVGNVAAFVNERPVSTATPEGWIAVPSEAGEVRLIREGYEPRALHLQQPHTLVELAPVAGGVLQGRRIVIDPPYGAGEAGTIGPSGMRASDYSLDVARRLAALLTKAGADAILTRPDDSDPTALQRLAFADDTRTDVFITISFGVPIEIARLLDETGHTRRDLTSYVAHYPGSSDGARLAAAIATRLGGIPTTSSVYYLIQQTPCPAVLVQPATIADPAAETRYLAATERRTIAQSIYEALLFYFSPQEPLE